MRLMKPKSQHHERHSRQSPIKHSLIAMLSKSGNKSHNGQDWQDHNQRNMEPIMIHESLQSRDESDSDGNRQAMQNTKRGKTDPQAIRQIPHAERIVTVRMVGVIAMSARHCKDPFV